MAEQESVYLFSTTALTNGAADPAINFAEGQLPSTVNNSTRALMAAIARYVKDTDGSLTTAGSSNAYTLTINGRQTPLATGHILTFKASFANTGAATLAVTNADSVALGTKAIRGPGDVALASGQIVSGGVYICRYDTAANSAAGAWLLLNPAASVGALLASNNLSDLANIKTAQANLGVLEQLTTALTIYVRKDGSDSNTGRADNAGGAYLTIGKAVSAIDGIDSRGFAVTIQVRGTSVTYAEALSFTKPLRGGGTLTLVGDNTTPANIIINSTGDGITVGAGVSINISGFKFTSTAAAINVGGIVNLSSFNIGACTSNALVTYGGGALLNVTGNFTVSGGGGSLFHIAHGGGVTTDASTCTFSGSPAYSAYVVGMSENSWCNFQTTWSGTVTGIRSFLHQGATCEAAGGAAHPDDYFPGSVTSTWINASFNDLWPPPVPTESTIGVTTYTQVAGKSVLRFGSIGATCTVTLLDPAKYAGTILECMTYNNNLIQSASSNVVNLTGSVVSQILPATAGKWARFQSDGTYWRMIASN